MSVTGFYTEDEPKPAHDGVTAHPIHAVSVLITNCFHQINEVFLSIKCALFPSVLESRDDEKAQQFAKAQKDLYEKTISAHV